MRTGVVILVWVLLVSAAVAKPAKRSKEADKGGKSGGESADAATFKLVRPENAGMMNLVPARVVLDPDSGVRSKSVTHLRPPKKEPPGLVLVGGDMAALSVRPGTYSVEVTTPLADQPRGYPNGTKQHVWHSPKVKVVLSRGETICLVLEPGVAETDYDGSWAIGKAVSPADCGSLTEKVQHDDEGTPVAAPAP